jgi:hypothetical protein
MTRIYQEDHVLPRPVEKLPEYAQVKSRRAFAERAVAAFGVSEAAAAAMAAAVVDPSALRSHIGEPSAPQVEKIPVPGGTLWGIRTHVWARRIIPDPRNPRTGPSRRHPFAVEPGTGGEDARFRPVPEPHAPADHPSAPELVVDLESRLHLEWAAGLAAKFVLAENDWRRSIASQGVMEAVWLVPVTYTHADGSEPVTVLTTAEGSSRTTAVHALLGIRSADVPYDASDHGLRAHFRRLNEALDRGATGQELVALRCERIPALILVGFERNSSGSAGFPTAVKSLVALRHVEPPMPWGEGPANESLADEVLDELYRRTLITASERAYYGAAITRAEARAAHLSDDPVVRASRIVHLFTTEDPAINDAIRVAVTSQSTRKRVTPRLRNELATALIVRSLRGDVSDIDQVRRYLRHGFSKAVHTRRWESTGRDTDTLAREALREVLRSIGDDTVTDPGGASLELAVRAAYPLVVTGRLNADRGTAANDQPDRRNPGEVLDAMRRTPQGVHQLGQALRDFAADEPIRAVDAEGAVVVRRDGSGELTVNDIYLRVTFPPPGRVRARSEGATPAERLQNGMADLSDAVEALSRVFAAVRAIRGHDGAPLVEMDGADPRLCAEWRRTLSQMDDDLTFWGRTYARRYGTAPLRAPRDEVEGEGEDRDEAEAEIDAAYGASYDTWDERTNEAPVPQG